MTAPSEKYPGTYEIRLRKDLVEKLLDTGLTLSEIGQQSVHVAATADFPLPDPESPFRRLITRDVLVDDVLTVAVIAEESGLSQREVTEAAAEALLAERTGGAALAKRAPASSAKKAAAAAKAEALKAVRNPGRKTAKATAKKTAKSPAKKAAKR